MITNDEFSKSANVAARIARHQTSGSAAKSLLSPCDTMGIGIGVDPHGNGKLPTTTSKKKNKNINHQAKHRRQLIRMQHDKKRQEHDEEARTRRQTQEMIQTKERQFGNIKSRVFEPKTPSISSVSTESTILSSSIGSLSLSSEVGDGMATKISLQNQSRFHKNFGQVPQYILKRRISSVNEDISNIETHHNDKNNQEYQQIPETISPTRRKKMSEEEFNAVLDEMKTAENLLRKELTKLPFTLSCAASKRRDHLMEKLKDIKEQQQQMKLQRKKVYRR